MKVENHFDTTGHAGKEAVNFLVRHALFLLRNKLRNNKLHNSCETKIRKFNQAKACDMCKL